MGYFTKICRENPNVFKIEKKKIWVTSHETLNTFHCRWRRNKSATKTIVAQHTNTLHFCIVDGDRWLNNTRDYALLTFSGNNAYAKAPRRYVTRMLPLLFLPSAIFTKQAALRRAVKFRNLSDVVRRHFLFRNKLLLHYELIYQLNAVEYLLCTFSSTCFGLTRPSSGAMDVTVSLHMQHMVSLV